MAKAPATSKINLQKMTRDELLTLQGEVAKALKSNEKQARKEALAAAQKAAADHGFALDEIMGAKKAPNAPKSAPKYANPADKSQTWTGRGRQPNWVKTALAAGKSLDSMAI